MERVKLIDGKFYWKSDRGFVWCARKFSEEQATFLMKRSNSQGLLYGSGTHLYFLSREMRKPLQNYIKSLPYDEWIYFKDKPKKVHFAELWDEINHAVNIDATHKGNIKVVLDDFDEAFMIKSMPRPKKNEAVKFFTDNKKKYHDNIKNYEEAVHSNTLL